MQSHHKGFTLIELVVVIVILGILAATALPKFVDLGTDARIAALNGLKGSLESAAREGYALCMLTPETCNPKSAAHPDWPNGSTQYYVVRNGTKYYFHYGYPIAWDELGFWSDGKGILSFVNYTGFTKQPYIAASYYLTLTKDGAPTPDNCYVKYFFPGYHSVDKGIDVSIKTDGC